MKPTGKHNPNPGSLAKPRRAEIPCALRNHSDGFAYRRHPHELTQYPGGEPVTIDQPAPDRIWRYRCRTLLGMIQEDFFRARIDDDGRLRKAIGRLDPDRLVRLAVSEYAGRLQAQAISRTKPGDELRTDFRGVVIENRNEGFEKRAIDLHGHQMATSSKMPQRRRYLCPRRRSFAVFSVKSQPFGWRRRMEIFLPRGLLRSGLNCTTMTAS